MKSDEYEPHSPYRCQKIDTAFQKRQFSKYGFNRGTERMFGQGTVAVGQDTASAAYLIISVFYKTGCSVTGLQRAKVKDGEKITAGAASYETAKSLVRSSENVSMFIRRSTRSM